MHLLIPFAAPPASAGLTAAAMPALPNLQALLASWTEVGRDSGDAWALSPPHERALARALGLQGGSGLIPWAARQARSDGIATEDVAWGLLTPTHWHLGTDQITLVDPGQLELDDTTSRACFDALAGLFTSEGFAIEYGAPLRWYIAHEMLTTLPTASLDRVIGGNVQAWLGDDRNNQPMRRIRRLQNEAQMLLYTLPANDQREARGLLPVNSFWLSGCGVAQAETGAAPQVDERLREPALTGDAAAWLRAWETLDAGPLAALLATPHAAARLTLCGERASATFEPAPRPWWQRWRKRGSAGATTKMLESL